MDISRREFLRILGLTGAVIGGAGAASIFYTVPDDVFQRALDGPKLETWKNSICTLCGGGCGIRVRLIDGVPVKISGNPLYPVNRGAICPMAEAGISQLFHPKKLRDPMKRVGGRGEGKWQKTSWEDAFAIIKENLRALKSGGNEERLFLLMESNNTLKTELANTFMKNFGSRNIGSTEKTSAYSNNHNMNFNSKRPPFYDLLNCDYILNFDNDLLDEGGNPVRHNQIYAAIKNRPGGKNAKIIHLSSYLSRTAANASKWIPVYPGKIGAMALGIAYVMIRDKSYDFNFIKKYTTGFDTWTDANGKSHPGFKDVVLSSFYPEKVSKITGVPAPEILKIAREFAKAENAIAITPGFDQNDLSSDIINYLNILKGNTGKKGGLLFPKTDLSHSNAKSRSKRNKPEELNQLTFFDKILSEDQNNINTLFINGSSLFTAILGQPELQSKLDKISLIVNFSSFLDDSSKNADLVIPVGTFMETWEGSANLPAIEFSHLGIQQPLIETQETVYSFGDIILQIDKAVNGGSLPWQNYREFLQSKAKTIFQSGEGSIISESVDLSWIKFLKKRGWQPYQYSNFEEFWDVLLENGGWWNPVIEYQGNIYQKKMAKFNFLPPKGIEGDPGLAGDNESPSKESDNFPFTLLSYSIWSNREGNPFATGLNEEFSGMRSKRYWQNWLEINPHDAQSLNIQDDELIDIISPAGKIKSRARILPAVMPGTISMPLGKFGTDNHNPLHQLLAKEYNRYGKIPRGHTIRVNIVKSRHSLNS